jgi:UDPglucose 6-dehydrogenase
VTAERLGVIGVGYVGLVTAACFAQAGHDVCCLDIDEAKLERLRAGHAPIHEPGVDELLAGSRERLTFTSSPADLFARADIAFVCVDTPPSASGDADLSRVESVIGAIPAGTSDAVLVMKSTVPPGTGARLRRTLNERGLRGVAYASAVRSRTSSTPIAWSWGPTRTGSAIASRLSTAPSAAPSWSPT